MLHETMFHTCGRPECLRCATAAKEEIERLRTALEQAEGERDEARALLDRAHDSLNELLAEHINIASPAADIAKRGLRGESDE